jgi:RNA polymerase sigma-70 factor (ECF subfamily)
MSINDPAAASDYLLTKVPQLRAYLRVLLGPLTEAEDVLQELFIQYLRHGPRPATLDADRWLFRVARNLGLKAVRGSRRRLQRETAYQPPPPAEADPAELADQKEAAGKIQRCLDQLDADVRELVYLKIVEDLSYREIAEQTGVPRSTAALRVQEGLVVLARCFQGTGA